MAKYQITYSCGHEGEIQLFGKMTERDRKIKWLESEGLCPECYKAKQAAEREEASAKAHEAAKDMGLPALKGSERQVAWAETIRQSALDPKTALAAILNIVCALPEDKTEAMGTKLESLMLSEQKTAEDILYDWCVSVACERTEAAWWIDNRHYVHKEMAKAVVEKWQK